MTELSRGRCITCSDDAIEAEVVAVRGLEALVRVAGEHENVAIDLVPDATAGDLLLCHAGIALERLERPPETQQVAQSHKVHHEAQTPHVAQSHKVHDKEQTPRVAQSHKVHHEEQTPQVAQSHKVPAAAVATRPSS